MTKRPRFPMLLMLFFFGCADAWAQDSLATKTVPAAPTIDLPLPWKEGGVLRYQMEQLQSKQSAKARQKSIATSTTELRTQRADKSGYEVHWVSRDSTHETLEGDASLDAILKPALKKMEAEPLMVVLSADGTYERVRNIDHLSARMREVMAPVMVEALGAGLKASGSELSDAHAKEAKEKAQAMLDTYLDNITSPKVLESMATKQARNIAFFNAGGLEDGASYELETELENPTGGPNFPAKLTYGLSVSKDDPEDVFIEWTSTIDPVKGASALVETVKRLFGEDLKALEMKDLPDKIAIKDTGLMLVHRPTGMVEMYEDERTTTFGDASNYERNRLRLLDAGHGHEWKDDP